MIMENHYDFIVLGGGSAGYAGARTAESLGAKVAIVDGSKQLGGLCILKGCMPSKTLLYVADILHHARHGGKFGLNIPEARADMAAVYKRKKEIIDQFASYRVEELQADKFDLYPSNGRFIGPGTLELDDGTILTAEHFLISTGSRISKPDLPGLNQINALTSDDVLDLEELPRSVIVLGGGFVACELAQYLRRMGTHVTMIQRSPRILKKAPVKASETLMHAFIDEGIKLYTDTEVEQIEKLDSGKTCVHFKHKGKSITAEADLLFNALGRHPATQNLGLDKAEVELTESGHIKTDAFQQTTNPKIYAGGDCAGPHEIVHIAVMQGEIAAKHAMEKTPEPINEDHLTTVVFTDPQVATTGLSEEILQERNIPYVSAHYPFDDHGKSILMEAKYGYVKVYAHKETGRILGAECVGRDGGELIHAMAVGVGLEATVLGLLKAHWYHPTLSEIWTYPLEDIEEMLRGDHS